MTNGQTRRGRPALNKMRCASAVIMVLAAASQAHAFYSVAGRLGGAPSRYASVSGSRQVFTSSVRPATARVSEDVLRSSASPYSEYMALRREKEGAGGGTVVEASPAAEAPSVDAVDEATAPEVVAKGATAVGVAPGGVEPPKEQMPQEDAVAPAAAAVAAAEAEVVVVETEDVAAATAALGGSQEASDSGDEVVKSPLVIESRTMQLSKRVGEEVEMATSRAQRMSDLSSELKRSFARKEEVENVIASEIAQLSRKLQQERDIEIAREADLQELLNEFGETIVEKQELIESEQDLLAQMQALREQVLEPSIRKPIEAAMAKKADVTSIEVMLLEDLLECKDKLQEELKSTSSRADTMNGVVAALPSPEDTVRMRAYNWQDVQDLQEVLLSSVESMEASDAQVGSLRAKLLDSVRQKREVLGEASSTELVQDGADDGAKRISTGRAFQASKDLTEKELLDAVANSSKSAAVGVAKTLAAGASSLGSYAKSPEAQDVAASTVDVIGAISEAAASIGTAFRAAKKEFEENSLPGEELTSFDKIFNSFRTGVKAVQESSTVKSQLADAGNLVSKKLPQAGARVGKGAVEALKGAASSEEIGNPVREALDSVEKFIVSMAALGSKYFTNSKAAYFQLPGGAPTKEGADKPSSPTSEAPKLSETQQPTASNAAAPAASQQEEDESAK